MSNKIIKLIAAASVLLMLAACDADVNEEREEKNYASTSKKAEQASKEDSSDDELSDAVRQLMEEDQKNNTEADSEKSGLKDELSEADPDDNNLITFDNDCYSFSYDSSKWTASDENNVVCDAFFHYSDESINANFNVISVYLGADVDLNTDDSGQSLIDGYISEYGDLCKSADRLVVNGEDCLKFVISLNLADNDITMVQYIFVKNGNELVLSLTTGTDDLKKTLPYFEDVVNSVVLK